MKTSAKAEAARNRWRQSARFRALASENAKKGHRLLAEAPRCGAKTRTGQPCTQPGVGAGGRCRLHGGATPSGDKWHVAQFGKTAKSRETKLVSLQIREKKRLARVAAMPPEARQRYERRRLAFAPGSKKERAARRERRRQDADARELLARTRPAREPDPELAALMAIADALRKQIEQTERPAECAPAFHPEEDLFA